MVGYICSRTRSIGIKSNKKRIWNYRSGKPPLPPMPPVPRIFRAMTHPDELARLDERARVERIQWEISQRTRMESAKIYLSESWTKFKSDSKFYSKYKFYTIYYNIGDKIKVTGEEKTVKSTKLISKLDDIFTFDEKPRNYDQAKEAPTEQVRKNPTFFMRFKRCIGKARRCLGRTVKKNLKTCSG